MPIYNPTASSATTSNAITDYFTEIGEITAGMDLLIDAQYVYPTADSTESGVNETITYDDSVVKVVDTGGGFAGVLLWWLDGVDGSTLYSDVLFVSYGHQKGSSSIRGIVENDTAGQDLNGYYNRVVPSSGHNTHYLQVYNAGYVDLGTDATLATEYLVGYMSPRGFAMKVSTDYQKIWTQGAGQWVPIVESTDATYSDAFQAVSCKFGSHASTIRSITPFMVWGKPV